MRERTEEPRRRARREHRRAARRPGAGRRLPPRSRWWTATSSRRGGEPRRGAPQGRHIHALLARGQQVLEELFPGLTAELVACGAPVGDVLGDARLLFGGHRLARAEAGLVALSASRPLLEDRVRARVRALPGVRFAPARRRGRACGRRPTAGGSPGCGCCGGPTGAPRRSSTPTWWSTPPGAAPGRRRGWRRWGSAGPRRTGCGSTSATPPGATGSRPTPSAATWPACTAPHPTGRAAARWPGSRAGCGC